MRQIWTLPKLTLAFSTTLLPTLDPVVSDSFDPPALSLPQDPPRKPQDLDVDQIMVAPLGESRPRPHLIVRCAFEAHRRFGALTATYIGTAAIWTNGHLRGCPSHSAHETPTLNPILHAAR